MKRQLVIKQSALGDMVLATGAFQAIRARSGRSAAAPISTGTSPRPANATAAPSKEGQRFSGRWAEPPGTSRT